MLLYPYIDDILYYIIQLFVKYIIDYYTHQG